MQDFDRKLQRKNSEMPITKHPEYAMYLSTRDMARLGLLMLTDGAWRDSQVMPKGWARRITTMVTHQDEIHSLTVGAYRTQGARGLWNAVVGLGCTRLARHGDGSLIKARSQRSGQMGITSRCYR